MFFPSAVIGSKADYANAADIAQADAIYDIIWALYTFMLACLSLRIRSGTFNLTFNLFFVFLALLLNGCNFLTSSGISENLVRASGNACSFTDQPIKVLNHIVLLGVCCILAAVGAFYSGIAAILEEQNQHCPVGHYSWTRNI
jgi:succinate-acetate transporter protein